MEARGIPGGVPDVPGGHFLKNRIGSFRGGGIYPIQLLKIGLGGSAAADLPNPNGIGYPPDPWKGGALYPPKSDWIRILSRIRIRQPESDPDPKSDWLSPKTPGRPPRDTQSDFKFCGLQNLLLGFEASGGRV